jgi:hypothetical protein
MGKKTAGLACQRTEDIAGPQFILANSGNRLWRRIFTHHRSFRGRGLFSKKRPFDKIDRIEIQTGTIVAMKGYPSIYQICRPVLQP